MAEARESRTQKLKGAHVLVIGGSSGLGFAVALAALDQGAHITVASSQKVKVDRALARLREASPNHPTTIQAFVCDLSQPSELEGNLAALFEAATSTAKLDHIVLTAGDAVPIKPIADTSVPEMLAAAHVRCLGALVIGKIAPKYINAGPKSSITFTGGVMSHRPMLNWTLQAAWGSAVEGATRGLSVDLAPIRVNCVSPGAIETELFDNVPPAARGAVLDGYRDWSLLGALGAPDEAAESYVYLMRNSFVTGTTSLVDGGRSVK